MHCFLYIYFFDLFRYIFFFQSILPPQLYERNSSKEFLQVMAPLFQNSLSFWQLMAAASSLVCGYTEGAFTRVTSFNWYEDNNYKAFLGISGERMQSRYVYDNSTSESTRCQSFNITAHTLLAFSQNHSFS